MIRKCPFLNRLLATAEIVPAVHQIEVHPTYQQAELEALTLDRCIIVEAYRPLGRGADLNAPAIRTIAERLGTSAAQIILRWHLQRGRLAIPKSTTPSRIADNIDLMGFTLTDLDLDAIDGLEAGLRTGEDVETFS
jgi:diketogulonate reductase-like aldo/keto reductase